MKPEIKKMIDDYREALRANHGDEMADKTYLDYDHGWFYVDLAQRFPDGSIGVISSIFGPRALRRKDIKLRTNELRRRISAAKPQGLGSD